MLFVFLLSRALSKLQAELLHGKREFPRKRGDPTKNSISVCN